MTSASISGTVAAFVTFDTLRMDSAETAAAMVETLTSEARERARHTAGFLSARIHLSLDGTTVVSRGQWADEADCPHGIIPDRPGVLETTTFGGTQAPGIAGPAETGPSGIASVATRHIDGRGSAKAMADLLVETGGWKRDFPGFISATPYISLDGMTYVNYPQWADEAAFHSYMADPRIAEGQDSLAHFEVAPPEFLLCRVVADITASTKDQTSDEGRRT